MCKKNKTSARHADDELARTASDAIQWLTTIPRETITVTAHNGHLDLAGRVLSLNQRQIIENVTRTLRGVRGVTNLICVEADPAFADVRAVLQ
jgi:osmotically-inducible protein OsmY